MRCAHIKVIMLNMLKRDEGFDDIHFLPSFEIAMNFHVNYSYNCFISLVFCFREIQFSGVILSSDDFFMKNGSYEYDGNKLGEAHEWNQKRGLL